MTRIWLAMLVAVLCAGNAFAQSWTSPKTWVSGNVLTAADMNTYIRDNTNVLRGGGFAVTSQAIGDLLCASSTTAFARLDGSHAAGQIMVSSGVSSCPTFTTSLDSVGYTFTNASASLAFSGATAPQIAFTAGTGLIASNLGLQFRVDADNNGSNTFAFINGAGTAVATLDESPILFVNSTSNTSMTQGITVQQAGNDNEILSLKSSDVSHGVTSLTETDTYGSFKKAAAANGGLQLTTVSAGQFALALVSVASVADTTHTASGVAPVLVDSYLKSGTTTTTVGANGNLFAIRDQTTTRFIVDAEGNYFSDDTGSTYDAFEDAMLALTWEANSSRKPHVLELAQQYSPYTKADLIAAGILAPDGPNGERGFVNHTALTKLAAGAVWQLGLQVKAQEARVQQLEQENQRLAARVAAMEGTPLLVAR